MMYYRVMVDEAMRIRVIRAIIGMDKLSLSKRCDVNCNTIRNWESGT